MENGYVSKAYLYRTVGIVLFSCAGLLATAWWAVLAQHSSTPHPATSQAITETRQEVTRAVEQSEERLAEQLDKGYQEQKALNEKLDWVIQQMIEDARARGNTQ